MSAAIQGVTPKVIAALKNGDFNNDLRHGQASANAWALAIAEQPKFFLGESPRTCPSSSLKGLLESGAVSMHELLPFSEMIIEFSFASSERCVLLCKNATNNGKDCIQMNMFFKPMSRVKLAKGTLIMQVDQGTVEFGEAMWNGSDLPHQMRESTLSLFGIVLHLYELLQCKNVEAEQLKYSKSSRAKRISKGKQPIFDYWVLNINDAVHTKGSHGQNTRDKHVRLHLRRGHVRNHPTAGRVWVRQCAVGAAENGEIKKDYSVSRGAHA